MEKNTHTEGEPQVRCEDLLADKARLDWLETQIDHIGAGRGAPQATRISVMLNGGHFTAREVIDMCMKGDAQLVG